MFAGIETITPAEERVIFGILCCVLTGPVLLLALVGVALYAALRGPRKPRPDEPPQQGLGK